MTSSFYAYLAFGFGSSRNLIASLMLGTVGYSQLSFSNLIASLNGQADGGTNQEIQKLSGVSGMKQGMILLLALRILALSTFHFILIIFLIVNSNMVSLYKFGLITIFSSLVVQSCVTLYFSFLIGLSRNLDVQRYQLILNVSNFVSLISLLPLLDILALPISTFCSYSFTFVLAKRKSQDLGFPDWSEVWLFLKRLRFDGLKNLFIILQATALNSIVQFSAFTFVSLELLITFFFLDRELFATAGLLSSISLASFVYAQNRSQDIAGDILTFHSLRRTEVFANMRLIRRKIIMVNLVQILIVICVYLVFKHFMWQEYKYFWNLFPIFLTANIVYASTFYSSSLFLAFQKQRLIAYAYLISVSLGLFCFFLLYFMDASLSLALTVTIIVKTSLYLAIHSILVFKNLRQGI